MKAQKTLFVELKKMLDQNDSAQFNEKLLKNITVNDAKGKVQTKKFVSWLYHTYMK